MDSFMQRIESRENPRFKHLLKRIAQPRLLRREGQAVAEGLHLLQELGQWPGITVLEVWFSGALRSHREWSVAEALLMDLAQDQGVDIIEVPAQLYERLSELEQGLGPLIVFQTPVHELTQAADIDSALQHDVLILDGVQDPGNVGTIIRTAAAAGIAEIWTSADTAWPWSSKVLRAAMGGHRHVQLPGMPQDALAMVQAWRQHGTSVRLMGLSQATDLYAADLRAPGVWLLGSEGQGVSPAWSQCATDVLRIPMQSGVESLNVGVAAGLCLYEQARQRGWPTGDGVA